MQSEKKKRERCKIAYLTRSLESPRYERLRRTLTPHVSTSSGARTCPRRSRGASHCGCSSQLHLGAALMAASAADLAALPLPLASGISPTETVFQRAAVPGGS